jgi:hypothetical protein
MKNTLLHQASNKQRILLVVVVDLTKIKQTILLTIRNKIAIINNKKYKFDQLK